MTIETPTTPNTGAEQVSQEHEPITDISTRLQETWEAIKDTVSEL